MEVPDRKARVVLTVAGKRRWLLPLAVALGIVSYSQAPGMFTSAARTPSPPAPPPPPILRFIEGIDDVSRPMSDEEVASELNDRWATLVLRQHELPATLDEILQDLDKHNDEPAGVPESAYYLVSESGQIPISAARDLKRRFRMVVARGRKSDRGAILMGTPAGARQEFEVISWDPKKRAFNFYNRRLQSTWTWKGDSRHAHQEKAIGNGCFQCHVNGTLIMKELKLPWNNWHTQAVQIPLEAIPLDSPVRTSSLHLYDKARNAEDLERIVRAGIHRSDEARVARLIAADGIIREVPSLLRQLFETTTVNLASSPDQSTSPRSQVQLPATFFLNLDAFGNVLNVPLPDNLELSVDRKFYNNPKDGDGTLQKYQFGLKEGDFRQPGDTYFAFLVPEPAQEDVSALQQMIDQGILTPHFAASVLMVDFPNPLFSAQRARLMRYVPPEGKMQAGQSDLPERIAAAIEKAAASQPPCDASRPDSCTPEQQFLNYWKQPEDKWRGVFAEQFRLYMDQVRKSLSTRAGFDACVRLAESRRQQFRLAPCAPLIESALLFPANTVFELRMNRDGMVSRP